MKRISSVDVTLPLESGNEMRLRYVAKPEKGTQARRSRLSPLLTTRVSVPALLTKM